MIVVLSGGVGGARLAAGLVQVFGPDELMIVVNTGDDFDHWGLRICPDIDTVLYTLSGRVNEQQGWGIDGDTWHTMQEVKALGGESWFRLGDQDLVTHLARTSMLNSGRTLSSVTESLSRAAGIRHTVTPVTDDPNRTFVDTDEGLLPFQEYFVKRQCLPKFLSVRFLEESPPRPAPALANAMASTNITAVVLCPSNPVLSIQPLLAVTGLRQWLQARRFPVLAVSPFLAGAAVKGPAAKIFQELGLSPTLSGLSSWYAGLVDGWLVDPADANTDVPSGVEIRAHHIRLGTSQQRREVAGELQRWLEDRRAR